MKIRNSLFTAASVCGLFLIVQSGFSQGSLTPPGPPGPTMKTLAQVEPRTIVNAANTLGDAGDAFIISRPGSYYLTTNITGASGQNGIEITANNVTLDLDGFTVQGVSGSADGIDIPGTQNNITVRNGIISGWEGNGLSSDSPSSLGIVFERLNVSSNDTTGIELAGLGEILDCNSQTNLGDGIDFGGGNVSGCTAIGNAGAGINGEVGLFFDAGIIAGCSADENGFDGIDAEDCTVTGCNAVENSGNGISAFSSVVSGCTADDNLYEGIFSALGAVSGCSASGNITGIYALSSVVSGCFVEMPANSTAYGILVAPTGKVSSIGSLTGNTCVLPAGVKKGGTPIAGIFVDSSANRIEDNYVAGALSAGISVVAGASNNVITKNTVTGSGANNYVVPAGNDLGPVGTAATSTSPWANISH